MEKLSEGIYQIKLPINLHVESINAYLLWSGGDELVLVDTGPNFEKVKVELQSSLRKLGLSIENISKVIITHGHPDHYGLAADIKEISGAKICLHPADEEILSLYYSNSTEKPQFDRIEEFNRFISKTGTPETIKTKIRELLKFWISVAKPVKIDTYLCDMDIIEIGESEFQVIHTPGHTPGHISLYNKENEILISGDHLIVNTMPYAGPKFFDSLEKLLQLKMKVALPSHGPLIDNPHERIQEILDYHTSLKQKTFDLLSRGEEITLFEIAQLVFGRLSIVDIFLAQQEILSFIESEELKGRIESVEKDGIKYYKYQARMLPPS